MRAFTVTASVELTEGDRGWLVAHGDQGGGYGLYVDDGELWWLHNDGKGVVRRLAGGPVGTGAHELAAVVTTPGGFLWDVALTVDGDERATDTGFRMLFPMSPFEGIDVGIDRRSPVSWEIYEADGPFPFTGQAPPRPLRPRRRRPRLRLALDRHAKRDGRQVRVTQNEISPGGRPGGRWVGG